jgi:hypothetical protein
VTPANSQIWEFPGPCNNFCNNEANPGFPRACPPTCPPKPEGRRWKPEGRRGVTPENPQIWDFPGHTPGRNRLRQRHHRRTRPSRPPATPGNFATTKPIPANHQPTPRSPGLGQPPSPPAPASSLTTENATPATRIPRRPGPPQDHV